MSLADDLQTLAAQDLSAGILAACARVADGDVDRMRAMTDALRDLTQPDGLAAFDRISGPSDTLALIMRAAAQVGK